MAVLATRGLLENVVRVTNLETQRQGTGMLTHVRGRQHVVTTWHGHGPTADTVLEITQVAGDAVSHVEANLVARDEAADIAVFRLLVDLNSSPFSLPAFFEEPYLGQEVLIVGYPVQFEHSFAMEADLQPRPIPMVKAGVLAGFPGNRLYLDLIANTGFSGAPVVVADAKDPQQSKIIGMVRGTYGPPDHPGVAQPSGWTRDLGVSEAATSRSITTLLRSVVARFD